MSVRQVKCFFLCRRKVEKLEHYHAVTQTLDNYNTVHKLHYRRHSMSAPLSELSLPMCFLFGGEEIEFKWTWRRAVVHPQFDQTICFVEIRMPPHRGFGGGGHHGGGMRRHGGGGGVRHHGGAGMVRHGGMGHRPVGNAGMAHRPVGGYSRIGKSLCC